MVAALIAPLSAQDASAAAVNRPPTCRIVGPTMACTFEAPVDIALVAEGADPEGGPLSFEWRVDLWRGSEVQAGAFVLAGPTASFRAEDAPQGQLVYYRVALTVRDAGGLRAVDHVFVYPRSAVVDVAGSAVPIARVFELDPPTPLGGGSKDIEVLRDGWREPLGSHDDDRQFDTFHFGDQGGDDWIGYALPAPPDPAFRFTGIEFQEGKHFVDGGWFADLHVEVRRDGVWSTVDGVSCNPPYPLDFAAVEYFNGTSFETYRLQFDPVAGEAIRLRGTPGGRYGFVSVAELRVSALVAPLAGPVTAVDAVAAGQP